MSPEQAAGRLRDVGPASDIFSLGATLYTVLTGTVPQQDAPFGEMLRRVVEGKFPPPREIKPDIPRSLDAICLKAMSRAVHDRYPSAAALAGEIEHYLADEPVEACPEGPILRLRRWTRHHPRIVGSLAAALLVGLVSAVALWGFAQVANQRLEEKRIEAEQARERAEAVASFMVETFSSPNPERDGKTITVYEVLRRKTDELSDRSTGDPRIDAELYQAIGRTFIGLGVYADAVPLLEHAYRLSLEAFGPDDADTQILKENLSDSQAMAGQTDDSMALHQEELNRNQQKWGDDHPDTLNAMNRLAFDYRKAGRWDQALQLLEPHDKVAQSRLNQQDLLNWQNNLATAYQDAGQLNLALPLLEQIWKSAKDVFGPTEQRTLMAKRNLANALYADGKLERAAQLSQQVLAERMRTLASDSPDVRDSLRQLQGIQLQQGDYRGACESGRQWIQSLQQVPDRESVELASAQIALADALWGLDETTEAMQLAEAATKTLSRSQGEIGERLRGQILLAELAGWALVASRDRRETSGNI